MSVKTEITKIHYNKFPGGIFFRFLKLCSIFYGIGAGLKNYLYDVKLLRPKEVKARVVSVGNLTTGGVGKTPVVCEIAKYFVAQGERTAIISRGYGGKLDNKNVNVISDGINLYYKADMAGDEPYWLAVNLNMCAVLTCADRYKAAVYAITKLGITTIILDDGFQHRRLKRDIDIVLIDSEKQLGNGNLLPAGPLRENAKSLSRADKIVIVSKNFEHDKAYQYAEFVQKEYPNIETFVCQTEPDYVYNIITGEHLEPKKAITALSAIGQPEQFYNFLERDFNIKNRITFDDHHIYTEQEINKLEGIIVTTEKDAVKIAQYASGNIFAMKLKTVVDVERMLKLTMIGK